jgi:hypothetical protein
MLEHLRGERGPDDVGLFLLFLGRKKITTPEKAD